LEIPAFTESGHDFEAMKKAEMPVGKKPAAKKSSTKPKRDVEEHYSQLAQIVTRLEIVADKLAQTAERLAQVEVRHPHTIEHAAVTTQTEQMGDDTRPNEL
jgi:hypothetical protein